MMRMLCNADQHSFKTGKMRLIQTTLLLLVSWLILTSCASSQPTVSSAKTESSWQNLVASSPVFRQNHTGFALYDVEKQEMVAEYQSDRYFTPASNTKLFTLYAGLCLLGDSIPALRYTTKGDSLIFWGTGDPNLLHPDMPASNVFNVLKIGRDICFIIRTITLVNDSVQVGRGAIIPITINVSFHHCLSTETLYALRIE